MDEPKPPATPRRRRVFTRHRLDGRERARAATTALGTEIRTARRRRRLSQTALAKSVGISQSRQSDLERGHGLGLPPEVWFAEAAALGISLMFRLATDPRAEPADAGHLAIQELVLKLARSSAGIRTFEMPVKATESSLMVDVGIRDDGRRALVIYECWNTFGGIGASVRNTRRKIELVSQLAAAIGGDDGPYAVAACWVVRDTRRNRELLAKYAEVFETAFPASSAAWARALTDTRAPVPTEMGLIWCDARSTRVFAQRSRRRS